MPLSIGTSAVRLAAFDGSGDQGSPHDACGIRHGVKDLLTAGFEIVSGHGFVRSANLIHKKLSEIFLQLHIIEKSGRGMPKIIEAYGKEAFEFRKNSIVVTIPFNRLDLIADAIAVMP